MKHHKVLQGQLLFQYDWERLEEMNCSMSEQRNEVKARFIISSLHVTLSKLPNLYRLQFSHL